MNHFNWICSFHIYIILARSSWLVHVIKLTSNSISYAGSFSRFLSLHSIFIMHERETSNFSSTCRCNFSSFDRLFPTNVQCIRVAPFQTVPNCWKERIPKNKHSYAPPHFVDISWFTGGCESTVRSIRIIHLPHISLFVL